MLGNDVLVAGGVLVAATAIATALGIKLLWRVLVEYALARPNARSSHRVPTPQGGGAAIVVAFAAGVLVASLALHRASLELVLVVSAGAVLGVVGAIDDIFVMRALPRLACQLAAAIAIMWTFDEHLRVVPAIPLTLERAILVVALVWFVNLVNFMDGIDWITVVEMLPLCAGIGLLAVLGKAPPVTFVAATALGGAFLGFAPFNRPTARLFLGDVGSLPAGLWLGWLLILIAVSGHLAAAILMPLYYLADATLTLLRRASRRERIWEAHRTHFYQRATDRGLSVLQIDARILVVNVCLVALAIGSACTHSTIGRIACVSGGAAIVAALLVHFHRGPR